MLAIPAIRKAILLALDLLRFEAADGGTPS
jgi:hypothetical protein